MGADLSNEASLSSSRRANGIDESAEMAGRMQPAVDRVARRAHALVDKAGYAASDAAEAVARTTQAVLAAPKRAVFGFQDQVRERPIVAVALAAVLGALVYGCWR
jgi:ElaB/YqjD/DUF883 family membrane-anchored ribosome-binding protein